MNQCCIDVAGVKSREVHLLCEINMSGMYSQRGFRLRVIDDFKFHFHKFLANGIERWLCTQRYCTVYVKYDGGEVIEEYLEHNHKPDPSGRLTRQRVGNA